MGPYWYFIVLTVLGQAQFGVYPDEASCRVMREAILMRLADHEMATITTPCAPAHRDQLERLGVRVPPAMSLPDLVE